MIPVDKKLLFLLESDGQEAEFYTRVLAETRHDLTLRVFPRQESLLEELFRLETKDGKRPALIIANAADLDNRPEKMLKKISESRLIRSIPIIFMSNSALPQLEVLAAFGAHSCVNKTKSYREFVSLLRNICTYWLDTVLLPRGEGTLRRKVLMVENEVSQSFLAQEALQESHFMGEFVVVGDGIEALDYLHHKGMHEQVQGYPDLIILDLRMEKMDGLEFLSKIKGHPQISRIPVVTLSFDTRPEDVAFVYDLGAYSFIVNKSFGEARQHNLSHVLQYWLDTVVT